MVVPKTDMNRPIIEFGGMEGFFYWQPFFTAILGTAFWHVTISNGCGVTIRGGLAILGNFRGSDLVMEKYVLIYNNGMYRN